MGRLPPRPNTYSNPLKGWWVSVGYAWEGLAFAWRNQRNFRIEVYLAVLVLGLAAWLGVGLVQVLILITVILGLELANTALEALVDLVSPEFHPLAKAAKDMAAGAVLIASALSALIGLILFIPPLGKKLGFW